MTNGIISKPNLKDEEMLKRLDLLKEILANKTEISIIGHDNIDVDAVLSGILLSKLLKFLNFNASFIILQPVKKNDTYEILRELTDINMYNYEQKNENDLRNLFLVDHYETTHKGKIIGCIDHHPIKKMNIDQITSNGQKKYSYNGHKVESAYLQLYGMPDKATLNNWLTYLSSKIIKKTSDTDMAVFLIFDTKSNITYEYQIMKYYVKKIIHEGILSRGKDIIPKIEKRYCNETKTEKQIETIIKRFSESEHTIATMESCTGGSLAGSITNVSGASDVLHESYITYCNEAKIKFGVPKKIIEEYTVYSLETAKAMANAAKNTANADVGIGITGQLGRIDPKNTGIENNKAWYAIRSSEKEIFAEIILNVGNYPRAKKKEIIIKEIISDLYCL